VRRAIGALKKQSADEVFGSEFALLVADSMAIEQKHGVEFCDWAKAQIAECGADGFESAATAMLICYGTEV